MAEIKYQYAYNENGKLVSIDECTKEASKLHTYYCVGCGNPLLPRAIGSKSRRAHFYHKELVDCSGETYIHKLAKYLIKQKFDNSDKFCVAYPVTKNCSNKECRLRNMNCHKDHERVEIDLKKYYNTCSVEANINGFIADLLLTNSKNPKIQPVLIEICVTHACEEEKLNSGLKIIEITIKKEQDVISIAGCEILEESMSGQLKKKIINFISFKRDIEEPMTSEVSRYIFNPTINENGYITSINCHQADYKLLNESVCELNMVETQPSMDFGIWLPLTWMSKNKNLRRCNLCKFYYATIYEETAICRLSRKYGKPMYPKMIDAETCRSYHSEDRRFAFGSYLDRVFIEEVISLPPQSKDIFRVIIAGSSSFENETLFKQKCDYFLGSKINSHKIIILSGTSMRTSHLISVYAKERSLIVEPHEADWDRYGKDAGYRSNEVMISNADALIAFWDGKGRMTGALTDAAKAKGIKVAVVLY